jgi:hypothetical protein
MIQAHVHMILEEICEGFKMNKEEIEYREEFEIILLRSVIKPTRTILQLISQHDDETVTQSHEFSKESLHLLLD